MGYRSIVCGVTGSRHAQKAAAKAAVLAKADSADLCYVYAVDLDFLRGGSLGLSASHEIEESLNVVGRRILNQCEQIAYKEGVIPPEGPHERSGTGCAE